MFYKCDKEYPVYGSSLFCAKWTKVTIPVAAFFQAQRKREGALPNALQTPSEDKIWCIREKQHIAPWRLKKSSGLLPETCAKLDQNSKAQRSRMWVAMGHECPEACMRACRCQDEQESWCVRARIISCKLPYRAGNKNTQICDCNSAKCEIWLFRNTSSVLVNTNDDKGPESSCKIFKVSSVGSAGNFLEECDT